MTGTPSATGGRSGEPRDHAGVPFPPPLVFLAFVGAGLLLNRAFPLDAGRGFAARSLAALLLLAGFALILWSGGLFKRQHTSVLPIRPSTSLVFDGPYRFTRNPMYLGMLSIQIGLGLLLGTWWPALLGPLAVIAVNRIAIEREERYLHRRFGIPYDDYRARVRRWI